MHKRLYKNNVKSQLHMDIVKHAQKTPKNITLNSQTNHSGSPERNDPTQNMPKESFLNDNGLKSPHEIEQIENEIHLNNQFGAYQTQPPFQTSMLDT